MSKYLLSILSVFVLLTANKISAQEPVLIELTQTPCQIVESELKEATYDGKSKAECKAINEATADDRPFKTLKLKPGKTIFRVSNKNVNYPLGFWVRGQGLNRLALPSVSGGGLGTGKTKDYVIDLEQGSYWYSCPLNITPDYPLIVE